jgi:hypothetical protein
LKSFTKKYVDASVKKELRQYAFGQKRPLGREACFHTDQPNLQQVESEKGVCVIDNEPLIIPPWISSSGPKIFVPIWTGYQPSGETSVLLSH